jgi:hypothetical protein
MEIAMREHILRNCFFESDTTILRNNMLQMNASADKDEVIFRKLTSDEIKLAESVFRDVIKYNRVKIYRGSGKTVAQSKIMTQPRNGGVIVAINEYREDFSTGYDNFHESAKSTHLFILAMAFVWQYYRYDSSFCDPYTSTNVYQYSFNKPSFNFYTLEQQASIIADYWLLNKYSIQTYEELTGCRDYERNNLNFKSSLLKEYKKILKHIFSI